MAQLPSDPRVNQYTATAGQTTFIYDFRIYADDEIKVQQGDDVLTLTSEYTVTDAGEESGGTVVLVTGATVGDIITLTGNTMVERGTTFTQGGAWNASAVNGEFNRLDNIVSELTTDASLNFKLAKYSEDISPIIPAPDAGKALVWNAGEDALENSTYAPDEIVAEAEAFADDASDYADAAALSATEASGYADDASGYADDASGYADDASGFADDASGYADAAAISAASLDLGAVTEDVLPDADDTYDLGSAAKQWAELHCTSITLDGTPLTGSAPQALYTYETAYNVDGGNYGTADTRVVRPINTEVYDDIGITLSTNQVTLPAGTYVVQLSAQAYSVGFFTCEFRKVASPYTPTTTLFSCQTGSSIANIGSGTGVVTLTESTAMYVSMIATGTNADGMGKANDTAALGNNIYLTLLLTKVA